MQDAIDTASSLAIVGGLSVAIGGYLAASLAAGRALAEQRVEREAGLPLVGRAPMHAVYRALGPIARLLVALGISANAVTVASLVIAAFAAVAFASGHFGLGAALAVVATLADAIDGLVARVSGTSSRFGKILDTTVDRFVDAALLGGVAVYVRESVVLLVLVLAAIVGSFMTSYASSLERELGGTATPGSMRRAHRLVYLLSGATLSPLIGMAMGEWLPRVHLVPLLFAVAAIAVVGNVSAVRRVLALGRLPEPEPARPTVASEPPSERDQVVARARISEGRSR